MKQLIAFAFLFLSPVAFAETAPSPAPATDPYVGKKPADVPGAPKTEIKGGDGMGIVIKSVAPNANEQLALLTASPEQKITDAAKLPLQAGEIVSDPRLHACTASGKSLVIAVFKASEAKPGAKFSPRLAWSADAKTRKLVSIPPATVTCASTAPAPEPAKKTEK